MSFIAILTVYKIFNFVYSTGEDELVRYSKIAQLADTPLITFDFAVKPSTMIPYTDRSVIFLTEPDFDLLDKLLESNLGPTFVIVKNKNLRGNAEYRKKVYNVLKPIQPGQKYSLYYTNDATLKRLKLKHHLK